MRKLLAATIAALVVTGAANAGWAGSSYEKSECVYRKAANELLCERHEIIDDQRTEEILFADATCPSTARIVERVGGYRLETVIWSAYRGRVPTSPAHLQSNSYQIETWHDYTDTVLGCFP